MGPNWITGHRLCLLTDRWVNFATVHPPRAQRASAIVLALAGQLASWGRATAAQLPDSQHILRSARSAQAEFESLRRHNLPREPGHGGTDCDEHVGRFCYWYDDDGESRPPPPPPPEAAAIIRARDRLLTRLDSAALALPGDEWIAGQRVRYLLQSGRSAEALAAARTCPAQTWWCQALTGLAWHVAGDYSAADSAYRVALDAMPPDERCRWTDISALLEGDLARRYRRLSCGERGAFERRLWWLAQPLYSLPGNDRRTEHLARATMARIEQDARSTYGVPWGDDLRELMLRFGWPAYWTQAEPPTLSGLADTPITGHDPEPAFHFLPDGAAFDDTGSATPQVWDLRASRARERYAPHYATAFAPLEHQVALFPRRDSCLVVAAYDVRTDTLFSGDSLQAALVLARDERSVPVIERRPGAKASDVIVAKADCASKLVSLELVAPTRRHVARARYCVRPPGTGAGLSLSDILLFDPPDSLPTQLAAALPYVRGSTVADPRSRLGLFWEIAGLDSGEVVTTEVTVLPVGTGWLRKAAESLRLAGRRASVRLQWREVPEHHGAVASRALALDLSGLSPGPYRIELVVHGPAAARASAIREITVRVR